jgi:SSS family solute:Na+ symporter
MPVSLLFFIIGTSLFAYYQQHPDLLDAVKIQAAAERLGAAASSSENRQLAASLQPADYGDKVMPHFIVHKVPVGLTGLIISALLAAAMSTISSGMNASATVFTADIYEKYFQRQVSDKTKLRILHTATVIFGLLGMGTGIAMIGVKSLLDIWWELSGIFAGGMLGLFLLGIVSRQTKNASALTACIIGILVILWMTFSQNLPDSYSFLRNPLHNNMIIVVGTLTIFLSGILLTAASRKRVSPTQVETHNPKRPTRNAKPETENSKLRT